MIWRHRRALEKPRKSLRVFSVENSTPRPFLCQAPAGGVGSGRRLVWPGAFFMARHAVPAAETPLVCQAPFQDPSAPTTRGNGMSFADPRQQFIIRGR